MLTQAELKRVLKYDHLSGLFTWLVSKGGMLVGSVAGRVNTSGHVQISIQNKRYLAHSLAWLYMTGNWPKEKIDHKNRIRHDNRFINLREATVQENNRNTEMYSNNKTGVKGVSLHKRDRTYQASASVNGKKIHLGSYLDIGRATKAYQDFVKSLHGEFYHDTL